MTLVLGYSQGLWAIPEVGYGRGLVLVEGHLAASNFGAPDGVGEGASDLS
jgi:hypothetical protein